MIFFFFQFRTAEAFLLHLHEHQPLFFQAVQELFFLSPSALLLRKVFLKAAVLDLLFRCLLKKSRVYAVLLLRV